MIVNRVEDLPKTLPIVVCADWCDSSKPGHPDEHYPEERVCYYWGPLLTRSLMPTISFVDGVDRQMDYISTGIRRPGLSSASRVLLSYEGEDKDSFEVEFVSAEARELAQVLIDLADRADGAK